MPHAPPPAQAQAEPPSAWMPNGVVSRPAVVAIVVLLMFLAAGSDVEQPDRRLVRAGATAEKDHSLLLPPPPSRQEVAKESVRRRGGLRGGFVRPHGSSFRASAPLSRLHRLYWTSLWQTRGWRSRTDGSASSCSRCGGVPARRGLTLATRTTRCLGSHPQCLAWTRRGRRRRSLWRRHRPLPVHCPQLREGLVAAACSRCWVTR